MAEALSRAPEAARRIEVTDAGAVLVAREAARTLARGLGFGDVECEQIAIAVSELAGNLVRHAGRGAIQVTALARAGRTGIQIEADDQGPGIPDPERAMTDGYSTAGGPGLGLGAVNRLMDDLTLSTPPGGGTRVVCARWIRPAQTAAAPRLLDFGVATRARFGCRENGDAFVVKCWPAHALVAVIDGLGHGELAQRAAQTARLFVEDHFDQPLEALFRGTGRACRATRGVVMALARFALQDGTFSLASVGNVETRLFEGAGRHGDFIIRRGIVGVNAPNPVVTTHAWTAASTLVLHSDGLHTGWTWQDLPVTMWQVPEEAAQHLLRTQGKDEDDCTAIVVRTADHGA